MDDREELEVLEELYSLELQDKRKHARNDFWKFCKYMDGEFFDEEKRPHLKKIAIILQMVKEGKYRRISISMAPRAGKSYIISMFCLWMLGLSPSGSIMRNSYAEKLAYKFSYDVRNLIRSDKFLEVFPDIKLAGDKQSIAGWNLETAKQVSYFCDGVGGSITGFGCDLLSILDDPIKNFEEAMSETILEKTWNWYTSVHRSRQEGCPEIHIATRWGNKDIIGRLKDESYFDYSIEIPALTEDNVSYCEANISTQDLLEIKAITDEAIFECIYQQNPIELKGLLFPESKLNRFSLDELKDKKPDAIMGATDTADKGNDYLSSPVAKIFDQRIFITDVIYTQDGVEITEPLVAQKIIDTKQDKHIIEINSSGYSFYRNVFKLIDKKSWCLLHEQNNVANKETRILMQAGKILAHFYFRNDYEPGSDYDKFMRHLTSYLKLKQKQKDDAPDSLAMLSEFIEKELETDVVSWG